MKMTIARKCTRRKSQRGSSLVESTLCFLGFMILALGVIEFSMAVYAYNFCSWAARDAARYASLHGAHSPTPVSSDGVTSYVRARAVALTSSSVMVSTVWTPNNVPGSEVQVTVSYNVIPMVRLALMDNLNVSSTSRMTISN